MKIKQVKMFSKVNSIRRLEEKMNKFIEEHSEDIIEIKPISVSSFDSGAVGAIYASSIVYLKELED